MGKSKGGGNPRSIPTGKTQVNFNIKDSTLERVKEFVRIKSKEVSSDIKNQSDVFNIATEEYLDKEDKKGASKKKK